jgi:Flp pilus assembly protein TadG
VIRVLRRAAADRRGVAAIEFALIFPMIFMLHLAAIEVLQAYQAQRAVSHIAAAMADITAQGRSVTRAEMDDILAASTVMIQPFSGAGLQQRVSSFVADEKGAVSRDWSVTSDGFTETGDAEAPDHFLSANESVIVTDVIYAYQPRFGVVLPASIRFERHAYARPRLSTRVELDD